MAAQAESYRIASVAYAIQGGTLKWILADFLDIDTKRIFADRAALDEYVEEKAQVLRNQRLFEDSSIQVTLDEADEESSELASEKPYGGGPRMASLRVKVKDAESVIVMPKPSYDSNSGLLFSLGWRDNNFLGTMQATSMDLKYTSDRWGQRIYGEKLSFDWPFLLGPYACEWNLDQFAGYYSDDEVLSARTKTGVDMILPAGEGKLRIGPSQGYYYNPYDEVEELYRGWYLVDAARAELQYPLPFGLRDSAPVTATIGEGVTQYWRTDSFDEEEREAAEASLGPEINCSQGLSMTAVNWIGNFRRGYALSASTQEDFDLGASVWKDRLTASASAYGTAGPRLGISGRLMATRCLRDSDRLAGAPLRGVLDTRIDADEAAYGSADLAFSVVRFAPGGALRILGFEDQWSIFADAAFVHNAEGREGETEARGEARDLRDFWYTGGLETTIFPLAFRSYYLRVSLGWDLGALRENLRADGTSLRTIFANSPKDGVKGYELFIGLGSHY